MRVTYTRAAAESMLKWDVGRETVERIVRLGRVIQRTASETQSCGIHAGRLITVRHTQVEEGEVLVINIKVTTSKRVLREHRAAEPRHLKMFKEE